MLRQCARSLSRVSVLAAFVMSACAVDGPTATVRSPPMDVSPALALMASQGSPTGVLLVEYAPGAESAAKASVEAAGGTVIRHLPQIGLLYVTGVDGASATTLKAATGISSVARDKRYAGARTTALAEALQPTVAGNVTPQDISHDQSGAPWFWRQWYLRQVRADAAWVPSAGGDGEKVCILDTGIDPTHQELIGRVRVDSMVNVITVKVFPSDHTPYDYNDRGTMLASLVSSNAAITASGAPGARLCSVKAVSEDGSVVAGDLVAGIVQAADLSADVITIASALVFDLNDPNDLQLYNDFRAAVAWAHYKQSAIVAAAGDFGVNFEQQGPRPWRVVVVPAMVPGVFGVGATRGASDQLTVNSDYGSSETVDLVAPGAEILAAVSSNVDHSPGCPAGSPSCYQTQGKGTPMAAALVSAGVAVIESSVRRPYFPAFIQMTPGAIAQCLHRTADKVGSRLTHGAGRLNILRGLSCSRYG